MWWWPGLGCHNLVSEPIPGRKCADEDAGPLREVDCKIPHRPGGVDHVSHICIFSSLPSTRSFGSSLASGSQKQNREGVAEAQIEQYRRSRARDVVVARAGMSQFGIRANPWPEVCRRGCRAPKGGGL